MNATSEVLTVEKDEHVATLWLDNPEKRNAMGAALWADMPVLVEELSDDPDVRAIVIAAKGPMFSAGIDINFLAGGVSGDGAPPPGSPAARAARGYRGIKRLQNAFSCLADSPKPVIAAVHGWCIGAGVDLITACDIRLAAADAKFSVRETRLGIVADVGTLQRLPRVIAKGYAAELAFTGRDIDAERARQIGLVNDVLPDVEGVQKAAWELAGEIAANPPMAVQGTKAVLRACENLTVEQGLDYIAVWNSAFAGSNDVREAITAFFEKRPAKFTGE